MDPVLTTEVHDGAGTYTSALVYAWLSYIREMLLCSDDARRGVVVYVADNGFVSSAVISEEGEGTFPTIEDIFSSFKAKCPDTVETLFVFMPTIPAHTDCTDSVCNLCSDADFIANYSNVVLYGTCTAAFAHKTDSTVKASIGSVFYETGVLPNAQPVPFLSYVADQLNDCYAEMLFDDIAQSKLAGFAPSTLQ